MTELWRYSINYGPEGEAHYANLTTPEGQHVANIRTDHAIRIVEGMNQRASPQPPRGDAREAALKTG